MEAFCRGFFWFSSFSLTLLVPRLNKSCSYTCFLDICSLFPEKNSFFRLYLCESQIFFFFHFFCPWQILFLSPGNIISLETRKVTSCRPVSLSWMIRVWSLKLSTPHGFFFGGYLLKAFAAKGNKCLSFRAQKFSLEQLQSMRCNCDITVLKLEVGK